VIAESGAIIEYLVEKFGSRVKVNCAPAAGARLRPSTGSAATDALRRGLPHELAGDELVFVSIPKRPMPFFAKPIARAICDKVQTQLVDPNLQAALTFIEDHLARNRWFAGMTITWRTSR